MAITKISAKKATLKYSTSAITYDAPTALSSESYGTTIASAKNITLIIPKSEVEKIDLIGETAVTIGSDVPRTGTFQNAVMDEKPYSNAVLTGTLVLKGDEDIEGFATGTGTATGGGTHTRYSFGDSTSSTGARPTVGGILLDLDNGSEQVTGVLAKPFVNMGDLKPTGPDGHFEVDFEATCLPEDFALEYKD